MRNLLTLPPDAFCAATKPCSEGRDWAVTQPTMADVWDNCPRPDWLLWIADKIGKRPNDRTLRLFAVWCARNTPLADGRKTGDLITDARSVAALEVAERYANLKATVEEFAAAEDAAWDAAQAARTAARASAGDVAGTAAWDSAWDAAVAAQAAHLRTLVPNPFKKEAQP